MYAKNSENIKKFKEYFIDFYDNENGIYPETLPNLKQYEIDNAIEIKVKSGNFDGDTIDREAVRDIILINRQR